LNFGAAALFRWKLHFEHVWAVSAFLVPQFGQNTPHLAPGAYPGAIAALKRIVLRVYDESHRLTPVHARH
jgi:hypothetical protein